MTSMRIGGTLMIPGHDGAIRLSRGSIVVQQGRIGSVHLDEDPGGLDLGGDDFLICPGFIDTHLHLPQFDSIGVDGLHLLDWLARVIFPAEARWEDADFAESMVHRVLDQLAAFGTTGFAAYATVHHEAARRAVRAIRKRGFRAMVGQVLMDRNAPDELVRPADQLITEAAATFDLAGDRVEIAVTPRFAVSCTDELLAASGELARKLGAPVQTHLAETRRECALIEELFDGQRYTGVYERFGLLGPRSILAHGIWLDHEDRQRLIRSGAQIAHCPTANLFLDSGRYDRATMLSESVSMSLGSDVAGGPDRSMVRVARAMIETAKNRSDQPPPPADAWWQITRGNADALGWHHCGRLEPGAEADLLVIRPDIAWARSPDPLGTLLYAWDDRWLRHTIVHGQIVSM